MSTPRSAPGSVGAATPTEQRGFLDLLTTAWIAIAGLLAILSPTDPDLFWHLASGRALLASGFPKGDVFSFTAQGHPWIAQEWMFDVVVYTLTANVGFWLPVVLAGAAQAISAWLVVALVRARGAGPALTAALTATFLVFVAPTWGVRAQLVTVPFAAAFSLVLFRWRRDRSAKRLRLLPLLMFGWVNLHASYSLGFMLLAVHLAAEILERFVYRASAAPDSRSIRDLLLAAGACAVATLLNPVGARLWIYPLPYILSGTPDIRFVAEWQSPDFHDPVNVVLAGSFVMLAVVGLGRPTVPRRGRAFRVPLRVRFDLADAGLIALGMLMSLRYSRLAPVYGVLVLPILGQELARACPSLSARATRLARTWARSSSRVRETGASTPLRDSFFLLVVLTGFAAFAATSVRSQLGRWPKTDGRFAYPVDATEYLRKAEGARIFNDYAWGGYLLYVLHPHAFVFIDGRADPYRDGVFDDYIAVRSAAPGYEAILDRTGSNFVLVPRDAALTTALSANPAWSRRRSDSISVLYERKAPLSP